MKTISMIGEFLAVLISASIVVLWVCSHAIL